MIVIVMGVSGSGKTTVAARLAEELNWHFSDADSFHSPQNVEKMSKGISLTDADRQPWLHAMRQQIARWLLARKNVVLACSALKAAYRQKLYCDRDRVKLVYLQGSFELIEQRMRSRHNHFMPKALLKSQFDTLEEPDPQNTLYIDAALPVEKIIPKIAQYVEEL